MIIMMICLDMEERPKFIEVKTEKKPLAVTIPDLQKIIQIFWPGVDINRIRLEPAVDLKGIRLTNIDLEKEGVKT